MTSNGRRLQNIKNSKSQQPQIRSSSNFKLKVRGPNQNENCLEWIWMIGRQTQNIEGWIPQQFLILWVFRRKLLESSKEISSAALLSPACYTISVCNLQHFEAMNLFTNLQEILNSACAIGGPRSGKTTLHRKCV